MWLVHLLDIWTVVAVIVAVEEEAALRVYYIVRNTYDILILMVNFLLWVEWDLWNQLRRKKLIVGWMKLLDWIEVRTCKML
jgi:hypothetical protein